MDTKQVHPREKERLEAVRELGILDTGAEKEFDSITALVANICDVPIAMVKILDKERVYLKARFGVEFDESPRNSSFCRHAILHSKDIYIVEDARNDPRFKENPLVAKQGVIFYAGVPLLNKKRLPLGTLCVFDRRPRKLNEQQKHMLVGLAFQVEKLFELKKKNKQLEQLQEELKKTNQNLKNFAGDISHDLKMPLAKMIVTTDVLKTKYNNLLDDSGIAYLKSLKQSALTLGEYISNNLYHYINDLKVGDSNSTFDFYTLLEEILELLHIDTNATIEFPEENTVINSNRGALQQILLNLISNSLKYNDKDKVNVKVETREDDTHYIFSVIDNGRGISKKDQQKIFTLFNTSDTKDRDGKRGHGIGLATVKNMVHMLQGTITVTSTLKKGATFTFSVKK